jgi:uncharacterized membrane protein
MSTSENTRTISYAIMYCTSVISVTWLLTSHDSDPGHVTLGILASFPAAIAAILQARRSPPPE